MRLCILVHVIYVYWWHLIKACRVYGWPCNLLCRAQPSHWNTQYGTRVGKNLGFPWHGPILIIMKKGHISKIVFCSPLVHFCLTYHPSRIFIVTRGGKMTLLFTLRIALPKCKPADFLFLKIGSPYPKMIETNWF